MYFLKSFEFLLIRLRTFSAPSIVRLNAVSLGYEPETLTISPSGKYAYIVARTSKELFTGGVNGAVDEVRQYRILADGSFAVLKPATAFRSSGLDSVDIDPSGRFAYIARDPRLGEVFQFRVLPGGQLQPLSPGLVHAEGAEDISIEPSGRFAYITDAFHDTVEAYAIGVDGMLSALPNSTVDTGVGPGSLYFIRDVSPTESLH